MTTPTLRESIDRVRGWTAIADVYGVEHLRAVVAAAERCVEADERANQWVDIASERAGQLAAAIAERDAALRTLRGVERLLQSGWSPEIREAGEDFFAYSWAPDDFMGGDGDGTRSAESFDFSDAVTAALRELEGGKE